MKSGMDRRTILRSHQLENAPVAVQELFWRRYNQTPRRRRPPASLQDLLDAVEKDPRLQPTGPLDEIKAAWEQAVPREFLNFARVEGLSKGCLRVTVDSSATRYVLSRQLAQTLIEAVNTAVGFEAVQRFDFRLGFNGPRPPVAAPMPRRRWKK